jgi:hypothetical protein
VVAQFKKIPALKHAAYSATTVLPGEDRAAFEKLHRDLIAEFTPIGPLEDDTIAELARLIWRKQNLATFRVAELAKARRGQIQHEIAAQPFIIPMLGVDDPVKYQEAYGSSVEQARQELGEIYQLVEIGEPATLDGLIKELGIADRLNGMINRCLKQLLMVRGIKSLSPGAASERSPRLKAPEKVTDLKQHEH